MSFREAVEGRHSVRRFTGEPVPRDDVREMVRLATLAANAGNAQMWRFVAVEDREVLARMRAAIEAKLAAIADWPEAAGLGGDVKAVMSSSLFFADAPLTIAVLALPYEAKLDRLLAARGVTLEEHDRLRQRPDLQSVGAAVQLLCTAVYTLGYGSCWMSAPVIAAPELEAILGVEPAARLVALVPVGRAAGRVHATRRAPVDGCLRFL